MSHAAFLKAILAAPDDDTPRLVYADWLEEHGGQPERAEFIRVQVELSRTFCSEVCNGREMGCVCLRKEWRRRERQLLEEPRHFINWTPSLLHMGIDLAPAFGWAVAPARWTGKGFSLAEFRRGFVEKVTLSAADWLAHADALLAVAPIRAVDFPWPWPGLSELLRVVDRAHATRLRNNMIAAEADYVARRLTVPEMVSELFNSVWPGIKFQLLSYQGAKL